MDTHAWVWSVFRSSELDPYARQVIEGARIVHVPPCAFREITQKYRSGKWPKVGHIVMRLPQLLRAQGGAVAPCTAEMAMLSGGMDRNHRDPFDRMIAATAIELSCPLITKDDAFDGLDDFPGWTGRIRNEAPAAVSP